MHELIEKLFRGKFNNEMLSELADAAVISEDPAFSPGTASLCFTTDSYVVNPLFFPGGDIGKLAVCGTVNDLAVTGAVPLYLSAGFIIEEGLDYKVLSEITESMARTAADAGVKIVTGDTKVVEKGSVDKLFINTAGIGRRAAGLRLGRQEIVPGDKIIINGCLGEHELAILIARGGFQLQAEVKSDCAPLASLIQSVLKQKPGIKFMRDPTRGGVATVLTEIVEGMEFGIQLREEELPLSKEVTAVCELLGYDSLYMANEGKVLIVVSAEDAPRVQQQLGGENRIIGEVTADNKGRVLLKTRIGGTRVIDMLSGSQLPRIC